MDFFTNPFSSQVGQRIDQATREDADADNLALSLEICDIINETDEGPKDAVKALKKRLFGNKNWRSVLHALAVLEMCVKNCGRRFHFLVCQKDFINQLTGLLAAKTAAPTVVKDRVLSLVQSWADTFRGQPDLTAVCTAYDDLRRQGVEFPAQDLDTLAPIYTPRRVVPEVDPASSRPSQEMESEQVDYPLLGGDHSSSSAVQPSSSSSQQPPSQPAIQPYPGQPYPAAGQPYPSYAIQPQVVQLHPSAPHLYPGALQPSMVQLPPPTVYQGSGPRPGQSGGPITPTDDQLAKVKSELDIVRRNAAVLMEMLLELDPGHENEDDFDLLQELNRVCRAMQVRVTELLERVAHDNLMAELLAVNDDLNAAFTQFDHYQSDRSAVVASQPAQLPVGSSLAADPAPQPMPQSVPETAQVGALIDFGDDTTTPPSVSHVQNQFSTLGISEGSQALSSVSGLSLPSNVSAPSSAQDTGTAGNTVDEFDMFAQTRQSNFVENASKSTYMQSLEAPSTGSLAFAMNTRNPKFQDTAPQPPEATGADNMQQWLAANDLKKDGDDPVAMTTTEFDAFLAERAAAAEPKTTDKEPSKGPARRAKPSMDSGDNEDGLFGL